MKDDNPQEMPIKSVNINRFNVMASEANVRIVFGEQITDDSPPFFHTAFVFGNDGAANLADLIRSLQAQVEASKATKQ